MDTKTIICHICMDVLDNPQFTSCLHVFCQSCLKQWMEVEKNKWHETKDYPYIACPLCRENIYDLMDILNIKQDEKNKQIDISVISFSGFFNRSLEHKTTESQNRRTIDLRAGPSGLDSFLYTPQRSQSLTQNESNDKNRLATLKSIIHSLSSNTNKM